MEFSQERFKHSKQTSTPPPSQVMHAIIARIIRIPRSIVEFIFQTYTKTSYPMVVMAWTLLLMARTVSAMPQLQAENNDSANITDEASRPNDKFHKGIFGIGVPVECRREYIHYLEESSQFDQIGMSVSTTLMALVPTLLSFAPLATAEIRSLLYFNTEIALLTAAMTLGLYNKGTSTLKKRNLLTVKELIKTNAKPKTQSSAWETASPEDKTQALKYFKNLYYPTPISLQGPAQDSAQDSAQTPAGLTQIPAQDPIQTPAQDPAQTLPIGVPCKTRAGLKAYWEAGDITPEKIQLMAIQGHSTRPKRYIIAIIIFFFGLLQITLFGMLVRALPMIDDIQFIWACRLESSSYFTWWLGGTAVASGFIRTAYASSSCTGSETFHLRPLPQQNIMPQSCLECSTVSDQGPPLKSSPLPFFIKDVHNFIKWSLCLSDFDITIFSAMARLWRIVRNLMRSNHAMVVVVRWRAEIESLGRNHPLIVLALGWIQAISLVFLTFLFGSAWNGTLFYTLAFVTGFLTVITFSRVLSLSLCQWMETKLDTVVLECDNEAEQLEITKVLLSMPGVLVESTTQCYKYAGGFRFDTVHSEHTGHTFPAEQREGRRPHQWRAVGIGFGILGWIIVWGIAGVIFYIASVPANEPFFPGPSHIKAGSKIIIAYFLPSISVSAVLGCALGFTFGLKVTSEFGALIIGKDISTSRTGV